MSYAGPICSSASASERSNFPKRIVRRSVDQSEPERAHLKDLRPKLLTAIHRSATPKQLTAIHPVELNRPVRPPYRFSTSPTAHTLAARD
jgi:hypothetical protein